MAQHDPQMIDEISGFVNHVLMGLSSLFTRRLDEFGRFFEDFLSDRVDAALKKRRRVRSLRRVGLAILNHVHKLLKYGRLIVHVEYLSMV
jgi:hypothetical protein